MSQADGYVRIVTQNDVSEAQRSTEQLGDTIHDALDTTPANNMTQAVNAVRNATEQLGGSVQNSMDTAPADNMTGAIGGLEDGISNTGEAALKTGDIIKANLVSEAVTQGIQKLGDVLKSSASRTIEIADGLDSSVNKIAAATNASAEEVNKLRSIVEQIYGDNFGEGFEDIADSISKIKQNLGELDDKELVKVTESAYALKDVFDYDIAESSRAVKAMMENFGVSASEAYDYIARGAQNGLDYSGELLDNISEYSVQFSLLSIIIHLHNKSAEPCGFYLIHILLGILPAAERSDLNTVQILLIDSSGRYIFMQNSPAVLINIVPRAVFTCQVIVPQDISSRDIVLLHKVLYQFAQSRHRRCFKFSACL